MTDKDKEELEEIISWDEYYLAKALRKRARRAIKMSVESCDELQQLIDRVDKLLNEWDNDIAKVLND